MAKKTPSPKSPKSTRQRRTAADLADGSMADTSAQEAMADVLDSIASVIDSFGTDTATARMAIDEMLDDLPPEARATLMAAMAAFDQPQIRDVVVGWMLTRNRELRRPVVQAMASEIAKGSIDAETLRRCRLALGWMPAVPERDMLASAVEGLRADPPARPPERGRKPQPPIAEQWLASVPDCAGAMSLVCVLRAGKKKHVVALMPREDFGVTEVVMMFSLTPAKAKEFLAEIESVGVRDIGRQRWRQLVEDALAEGMANGTPPSGGLIEAALSLDIVDLTPTPLTLDDVVTATGAGPTLAALTPDERKAILHQAPALRDRDRLMADWLDPVVPGPGDTLKIVVARLTAERQTWQQRLTRTALIHSANGAPHEEWLPLLATAQALSEGRALSRMPLMTAIARDSLDATEEEDDDAEAKPRVSFSIDLSRHSDTERAAVLARLGPGEDDASAWLDGLLSALLAAPDMVPPSAWASLVLEASSAETMEEVQDLLSVVMGRYNELLGLASDGRLPPPPAASLGSWCRGFCVVRSSLPKLYAGNRMKQDDRRMLRQIEHHGMALEAGTASEIDEMVKALGMWLAARGPAASP